MSEYFIPEQVEPHRYAEQQLELHGSIKISELKRLGTAILETDQHGSVDLQFGVDEQKITYVKGRIQATLPLQCQRCLEPYRYEIKSDFVLGVVKSLDEANALPEHYEPVMVTDGMLALREVIEDEIILNLPIIPRHDPENCKVKLPLMDLGEELVDKGGNPFDILKSLKQKQ